MARKDQGKRSQLRNHFATRITKSTKTDRSQTGEHIPLERREKSRWNFWQRPGNMDAVWQGLINRWQKVLRTKRVWWNCCIEWMRQQRRIFWWTERAGRGILPAWRDRFVCNIWGALSHRMNRGDGWGAEPSVKRRPP